MDVSSIATGKSKWCGGAVVNEKLYCIPYNATCILIYDLETHAISSVDVAAISNGDCKWDGQ